MRFFVTTSMPSSSDSSAGLPTQPPGSPLVQAATKVGAGGVAIYTFHQVCELMMAGTLPWQYGTGLLATIIVSTLLPADISRRVAAKITDRFITK